MPFTLTESHVVDYMSQGYTVFRGILPSSLVKDLRRIADKGRQLAREEHGPQAQRIQPIANYDLDEKPFRDYAELPALIDAIRKIIGPEAWYGDFDKLGFLLEPATSPWCLPWHRDLTAATHGVDVQELESVRYEKAYFNQVNCALYDDSSTWLVPGSHCRDDVASELAHSKNCPTPDRDKVTELGLSDEEIEMRCLEYCRAMPRAVCLHLGAGDFALYRPLGWHLGNYVPYRIRATLHDIVWTPQVKEWYQRWEVRREAALRG